MSKDNQEHGPLVTTRELVATATAAGAAAGQVLLIPAGTAPTVLALAATLITLFPPALAAFTEVGARRMRGRADRYFRSIVDNWAKDAGITHSEVAGILEAHKEDPNVSDAVWRAIRVLMDAPNEAAAVPLGVLTAEYARDKRPADQFFRGTVRLLSELSSAECQELLGVLDWTLAHSRRPRVMVMARNEEKVSGGKDMWRQIPWTLSFRQDSPDNPDEPDRSRDGVVYTYDQHPADAERLFFLLKTNGLARESGVSFMGGTPPNIDLERSIAQRLATLLRTQ